MAEVTDPVLIKYLQDRQINPENVDFYQDYAPRTLGKKHSPYAKFYKNLENGEEYAVISGLPMCRPDGVMIQVGWQNDGGIFRVAPNLFDAEFDGTTMTVTNLYEQPNGWQPNQQAIYTVELRKNDVTVEPSGGIVITQNPWNSAYNIGAIIRLYGICQRAVVVMEGRLRDFFNFSSKPNGDITVIYNNTGDIRFRHGTAYSANGVMLDVEVTSSATYIPSSEFSRKDITSPVRVE